jgi:hypothetical protein
MYQMPIVRQPIDGAVLAHWRHHDAIPQGDVAHLEGAEQIRDGNFAIVLCVGRTSMRTHNALGPVIPRSFHRTLPAKHI